MEIFAISSAHIVESVTERSMAQLDQCRSSGFNLVFRVLMLFNVLRFSCLLLLGWRRCCTLSARRPRVLIVVVTCRTKATQSVKHHRAAGRFKHMGLRVSMGGGHHPHSHRDQNDRITGWIISKLNESSWALQWAVLQINYTRSQQTHTCSTEELECKLCTAWVIV